MQEWLPSIPLKLAIPEWNALPAHPPADNTHPQAHRAEPVNEGWIDVPLESPPPSGPSLQEDIPATPKPSASLSLAPLPSVAPLPPDFPADTRPLLSILEAQTALVSHGISPGSIDGVAGRQTRDALQAFQGREGLDPTGWLDDATRSRLVPPDPLFVDRVVQPEDLMVLTPIPTTWLGKSEAPALQHETVLERIAEQSQAHPQLLRQYNPDIDWTRIQPGDIVRVPNAAFPPARRAALVRISLRNRTLRVFDADGSLLAHFPCSIGRVAEKRPTGRLEVTVVIRNPDYTFDPRIFPDSEEGQVLGRRLVLPPGPNNPVGVAWMGLSQPGYGIHGTPEPERVGRTESSGCFRLANWNADYLRQMAWVGLPVVIDDD
jgi:lipoprotein-anchoring transpeptidase ErfK/SrfK